MKIGRKRKSKAEIPTASMSDIAFLLIIFFMATTKFDVKEGIRMVLPQAAPDDAQKTETITLTEKEMTRIQITPTGLIAINNDAPADIDTRRLDAIISQKLNENGEMIFRVITDRDAKYNDMIRVVDRLKAANVEKISLSTN
ncbi:MAG: biopolymer transporter ExbD [Candidatus Cloacimonetes bacterium]|nr:biopolymer transporter ExbD [Candidatus Cloacimonadota bacterium]